MERNAVGSRELKSRLGMYLQRVRQGRTLVVTDRGEPIAEIRPLGSRTGRDAVLAHLRAAGTLTWTTERPLTPFRPIRNRGASVALAVLEDREDRFE